MIFDDPLKHAALAIHASDSKTKIVIAMAGNGTQAISELMRYGNGSNTLLAQHLLYDNFTFRKYIGGEPDKYVDPRVSRQLAMAAYIEAMVIAEEPLSDKLSYPVVGIGCTSALVRTNSKGENEERQSREHWIHVSAQDALNTRTFSYKLNSSLGRTREQEEWINTLAIFKVIAAARGAADAMGDMLECSLGTGDLQDRQTNARPRSPISEVVHGRKPWHMDNHQMPTEPAVVFAGSWNPLHDAHRELMKLGQQKTGKAGLFELSVTNTDKPPLDYIEIEKRAKQFHEAGLPLVLTNRPKYAEKVQLFPRGSTFVMGADTFSRVINPIYYGDDGLRIKQALSRFENTGTTFLVAARKHPITSQIMTAESLLDAMPEALVQVLSDEFETNFVDRWRGITTSIPQEEFMFDISSSQLRSAAKT